MGEVTELLHRAAAGDKAAAEGAFEAMYAELRRLARARVGRSDLTLVDATSLVHEFYLRLQAAGELDFNDRGHFLAYASRAMRSIVVDHYRARGRERRGGDHAHVPLDTDVLESAGAIEGDVLGIHEALERLEAVDARLAGVVQMRYFGGFGEEEIASALGISTRSVKRDWQKARLVLAAMLGQPS